MNHTAWSQSGRGLMGVKSASYVPDDGEIEVRDESRNRGKCTRSGARVECCMWFQREEDAQDFYAMLYAMAEEAGR